MTVLTDTWKGLVARKLWPLAILLVAALAAVPMLLASDSEPAPFPIASSAAVETTGVNAATIVAPAAVESREAGRRVLGARKNPFKPLAKVQTAAQAAAATSSAGSGTAAPAKPGASGSPKSGGTGSIPSVPVTPTTPVKKKVYEVNSLVVRFGESSSESLKPRGLVRLKALPSVSQPVVIYLGILEDGRTAAFLVDASATPQGDGRCNPHPQNCQIVHLRAGETEYFDVATGGADAAGAIQTVQYQLDLVKIRKRRTTNAAVARRAYAAEATGGRAAFRVRASRAGRLAYNRRTGKVRRLNDTQFKAAAARAAAVAKR